VLWQFLRTFSRAGSNVVEGVVKQCIKEHSIVLNEEFMLIFSGSRVFCRRYAEIDQSDVVTLYAGAQCANIPIIQS